MSNRIELGIEELLPGGRPLHCEAGVDTVAPLCTSAGYKLFLLLCLHVQREHCIFSYYTHALDTQQMALSNYCAPRALMAAQFLVASRLISLCKPLAV